MKCIEKTICSLMGLLILSFNASTQGKSEKEQRKEINNEASPITRNGVRVVAEMPKQLKEISGIVKDGNSLWAISDNPEADIYRLDFSGKVVQQLRLKDIAVSDVEDITIDRDYLYIADIGDNDGARKERHVIRIKKSAIGSKEKTEVPGEIIAFTFPAWHKALKKEDNNYDAEAILSYGNALYIFTKRRSDEQTELLMLPKTPGKHVATSISSFNSNGLITGAAMNHSGTEVALVGYHDGHQQPFVWLLSDFKSNNFFSGKQKRFELTEKKNDWQMEGVAFKSDTTLFLSCEETKDEPATLYVIDKRSMGK